MPDVSLYVSTVLRQSFDVAAEEIPADATLDDLGVDSVAAIELVDILKEEFKVAIDDDELTNKNTVGQVVDTVSGKIGG